MKKFLIVDGNSIVNRAFYGIRPLSTREGLPTNALFGMVTMLSRQLETLSPDYAVIAFDLKAPTFRHKLYAEYKAGRRPMPPELAAQMPLAKETARALGFCVCEAEGYEADDILGTLSRVATENGCRAYLLTGDRDALQLISDDVHVLLATNTETVDFDRAAFFGKYGVDPTQFVDVKALMGDSSDNIPGVAGVGEKTALALIAEHKTLDGVYADLPTGDFKPALRAKLEAGKESAYLSKTLATICREAPLDEDPEAYRFAGMRRKEALALFTKFEFQAFIKRFDLAHEDEAEGEKKADAEVCDLSESDLSGLSQMLVFDFFDGKGFFADKERVYRADPHLTKELLRGTRKIICHDAKSIYKKLEEAEIHWRGCYFDTMLAAWVLHAEDARYGAGDLTLSYLGENCAAFPTTLCQIYALYEILNAKIEETQSNSVLYDVEMPLCGVLADMELAGVAVDQEGLAAYGEELQNEARQLEERIYFLAGGEFNIQSPKQLGEVLFERLSLPHGKKTKTGYSTNVEVLEKLRPYHPIIDEILDYRQVTKLCGTYAEGLLKQIDEDGRIHTIFKQTGTATGRLSSAEPNLQNIPIRTERGKEFRRYFISRNNKYYLVDADYSQIELRLLAALSGDTAMCEAFSSGEDIHTETASRVFGVPPEAVTPELRKRAKAVNFGILYGMGAFSLSEDLHISLTKAKEYIAEYFAAYPDIDAYLSRVVEEAKSRGFVTTLFGRRRYIPELKMQNKNLQHFGERVAMNSPIQGTAADIIKIAMIRVDAELKKAGIDARLVLQVHDELIVETTEPERAREILVREMENAAALSVRLAVSAGIGKNWYECH